MSKFRPEERFPLLLYFVDGNSDLSKTNKRLYFDKGRLHGINNGATAVFTEWPNYVSTCWVATILSTLVFFMMMLLVLSSISTPRRIPRCIQQEDNPLDNKTVHLVHSSHAWEEYQLELLDKIVHTFPHYKIQLILIDDVYATSTTEMLVEVFQSTATGTSKASVGLDKTTQVVKSKKRLSSSRRRKRNMEKRLENMHFNIKMGAKRLLDILMLNNLNNTELVVEATPEPKESPPRTIQEFLEQHPEVMVKNTTYSEIFFNTPLNSRYAFFPEYLRVFAVRVLQLWQYGGISFDLEQDPDTIINDHRNPVTEMIVTSKGSTKPSIEPKRKSYKSFLDKQFEAYERLPLGVVTADDKGVHMETKTPCHAFFGEILGNLRKITGYPSVRDVLRRSLKIFCRHSVADRRYCETL